MDKRKLVLALVAILAVVAAVVGYTTTQDYDGREPADEVKVAEKQQEEEQPQEACASSATYSRLKEVVFEEAVRIRNADPANLDTLAANSVVRMENPVVKSRNEDLNVTVCTGRFVLELPPGSERAFGGERRLVANIEYAGQAAADGSGLVYQLSGAEPIIYRLAAFDLRGPRAPEAPTDEDIELADADVPAAPSTEDETDVEASPPAPPAPAPPPAVRREPPPAPKPAPRPRPVPRDDPEPTRTAERSSPSFNCRDARTRSEKVVCSSDQLAAKDRAMSSLFYSALSGANDRQRSALRRTRDRFLAYRERCRSDACIADAYDGRMLEIRDIMANR